MLYSKLKIEGRLVRMMKRILPGMFFALTFSCLSSKPTEARDVESTERLRLVQQATGQTPSRDSFQTRMDTIFATSPEINQNYVAQEDFEIKQAVVAAENAELLYEEKQKKSFSTEEDEEGKDKEKRKETLPLENFRDPEIDASEKDYQKQLDEIYEELDQRKEEIKVKERLPEPEEERKLPSESSLPPSLENNPFYFASDENLKRFEENKAVIINRLIQMGYSDADAEALVQEASSPEEVTIALMQRQGFSYGEASDTVRIDPEEG